MENCMDMQILYLTEKFDCKPFKVYVNAWKKIPSNFNFELSGLST